MEVCTECNKHMRSCSLCNVTVDYGIADCYNCLEIICLECQNKKNRFIEACKEGETDVIDQLIDQVPPNFLDHDSRGILSIACETPQPWTRDVVQRLLQAGADVDLPIYGCKPLQYVLAWSEFDTSIASMLLYSSKLGINHQFEHGWSYLYWCETVEAAQFLIDNGIDINIPDHKGETFPQCLKHSFPQSDINKLSIPKNVLLEQKTIEQKTTEDHRTEDHRTEDNGTEDIVTEDIVTEDIVTEDIVTEDIVTEDIVTEDNGTEDIVTEDIVTEDIVIEDIVIEDNGTEDIVTEDNGPSMDITNICNIKQDVVKYNMIMLL